MWGGWRGGGSAGAGLSGVTAGGQGFGHPELGTSSLQQQRYPHFSRGKTEALERQPPPGQDVSSAREVVSLRPLLTSGLLPATRLLSCLNSNPLAPTWLSFSH